MAKEKIVLAAGKMSLCQLRQALNQDFELSLNKQVKPNILAAAAAVDLAISEGKTVYGLNTGFGILAHSTIEAKDLKELQKQLLRSHATGVGALLADKLVRLIMLLKINSLARGHSGIRYQTLNLLKDFVSKNLYPCIPEKGSVGASGDLAPLAHLSLPLIGEGEVRLNGKIYPAKTGLRKIALQAIELGPKEGLALINGTQVSTALALAALFDTERLLLNAVLIGSMTVEACMASRTPFNNKIHRARGQKGQIAMAKLFRHILAHSSIESAHKNCSKVQDPYSLRCQPQVLGSCLDQLKFAAQILQIEANGVSDNPLVFPESNEIISGGNFHAEPVAMTADNLALVIAEIGALAERRIALMMDKHLSQLPPFLVENSGVNSGFMMAQVTAAALASENKSLAHPACVDSIPTSANQEDHVSMATFAARRLGAMIENTRYILAIELLAACQGVELRAPAKPSAILQEIILQLRSKVNFYDKDRYFAPDIEQAKALLENQSLIDLVGKHFPLLR